MFERFTKEARAVVVRAETGAREVGAPAIGPEHLLLAVARTPGEGPARRTLAEAGVTADAVAESLEQELVRALEPLGIGAAGVAAAGPPVRRGGRLRFTSPAKRTLEGAVKAAVARGERRIGAEHVLLGVLDVRSPVVDAVLADAGTNRAALRAALV